MKKFSKFLRLKHHEKSSIHVPESSLTQRLWEDLPKCCQPQAQSLLTQKWWGMHWMFTFTWVTLEHFCKTSSFSRKLFICSSTFHSSTPHYLHWLQELNLYCWYSIFCKTVCAFKPVLRSPCLLYLLTSTLCCGWDKGMCYWSQTWRCNYSLQKIVSAKRK